MLTKYDNGECKPSLPVYGVLIKASGRLKNIDMFRHYWQEMTTERAMDPNDIVLSCTLDALVSNGEVSEAVTLLRVLRAKAGANMVLCSIPLKGFAATGRPS